MSIQNIRQEIVSWCSGKNWFWRLPLLLYFAYVFVRHISDPMYSSVLGGINLGIHELGHFVFGFLGEFMAVAGGTLLQILIPVFGMVNFMRQEDYFSLALCFGWLSTNFFEISRYASDARSISLPLVSPFGGDTVIHDWEYMLDKLHILQYDIIVGNGFKILAAFMMLICLIFGVLQLWLMKRYSSR